MLSPLLQTHALVRSTGAFASGQPKTIRRGLLWAAYLDRDLKKEVRRRHRELKQTYREFFSLKSFHEEGVAGYRLTRATGATGKWGRPVFLKGFMCSAWSGHDRPPRINPTSWEWLSHRTRGSDSAQKTFKSTREMVGGKQNAAPEWLRRPRNVAPHTEFAAHSPIFVSQSILKTWTSSDEYSEDIGEIDPITNRRVYRNKSGTSADNSIHAPGETIHLNSPEVLHSSLKSRSDITELKKEVASQYDSSREYLQDFAGDDHKPVYGYEPDGQKPEIPDAVQEGLSDYDAITKYGVAEEKPGPETLTPPSEETYYDSITQYGVAEENPGPQLATQSGENTYYDSVTEYGVAEENPGPEESASKPNEESYYDSITQYGVEEASSTSDKCTSINEMPNRAVPNTKSFSVRVEEDPELEAAPLPSDTTYYDSVTRYGVAEENQRPDSAIFSDHVPTESLDYDGITKYGVAEEYKGPETIVPDDTAQSPLSKYDRVARYGVAEEQTENVNELSQTRGNRKETKAEKKARRQKLEKDFRTSQDFEAIDPVEFRSRIARNRDKPTVPFKEHKNLTGNFGRDFPEESKAEWKFGKDSLGPWTVVAPTSANPSCEVLRPDLVNKVPFELLQQDGASKIPLSLDRAIARAQKDGKEVGKEVPAEWLAKQSKHKENDSKKQHRELVREIRAIYEEEYGSIANMHHQLTANNASNSSISDNVAEENTVIAQEPEPTLYKILAYDPTMQSISIADTTSIVADSASPLTPAEVLLRLSNPAKFFPHFEPLQAQGYEIVSGSGDVLVFRKVRPAGTGPVLTKSEEIKSYQDRTRQPIASIDGRNPIDGMRPIATAAGNFASPTGFVNYYHPEPSDPPFKSNVDVRREEPVFSGKRNWSEPKERKKSSLAKRVLFGGAAVGGVSYAAGVVADYFKSGGSDGMGPQGF